MNAALPQERHAFGDVLLSRGAVTPDQLQIAIEQQDHEGGLLGQILLQSKVLNEETLLQALAEQLGMEYVDKLPSVDDIDAELVDNLPINFAKQQLLMPLRFEDDTEVVVAIADPLAVHALDDVRSILGREATPVLASSTLILELINKVYARLKEGVELEKNEDDDEYGDSEELVDILDLTDEAPIIRWVNSLMFQSVKARASDIHIEPGEKEVIVRYRIDGVLREAKRANRQYMPSILSRIKIMAGLNIAEKRLPQDGRIRRKIAGKDIDMRVATAPTANGERVTIRLLDRTSVQLGLADIGFASDQLDVLAELIEQPHGVILVTGPTGSGKTTTLYACLSKINKPGLNILTIEDPVEYQLEGISQTQVNAKIDLTFATGLRSFLRHDPNVIMVGEIRDGETASIAIQASLTGHLVLSTVHTNNAAGALPRLIDMGVEPFLVASSLLALLAQRLVRRVCPECRELVRPTAREVERLGLSPAAFEAGTIEIPVIKGATPLPHGHVYKATGCQACLNTGYQGRTGIYEILPISESIRQLTRDKADANTIKNVAVKEGMRTLRLDGAFKVLAGLTTIEEIMVTTAEDGE